MVSSKESAGLGTASATAASVASIAPAHAEARLALRELDDLALAAHRSAAQLRALVEAIDAMRDMQETADVGRRAWLTGLAADQASVVVTQLEQLQHLAARGSLR